MIVLTERDLQIKLPAGAACRKFDDGATHGLTHCMKAVDFVVELEDRILFIESSAALNKGEKIGLVGPNGAGKTTVFRMCRGGRHGEAEREGKGCGCGQTGKQSSRKHGQNFPLLVCCGD